MSKVVVISGLSGTGKTTALRALEDVGFFCMDNVPAILLPKVVELARDRESEGLAVVIDARSPENLDGIATILDELEGRGTEVSTLFLDADSSTLLRRFRETRRRHPLDTERDGNVLEAIHRERSLLEVIQTRADEHLRTTHLTVHELKARVQALYTSPVERTLIINLISFGFKHGALDDADLLFDVRFLSNPYFESELRPLNGNDHAVSSFVLGSEDAEEFMTKLEAMTLFLIPRYQREGKVYLRIGIGCTGGQHRSVTVTNELARRLLAHGIATQVAHRESQRWPKPSHDLRASPTIQRVEVPAK